MRLLLALLIILLTTGTAFAQDDELHMFTFDGVERTYTLHAPDDLTKPAPLVIALHGRFGSGSSAKRLTGFSALADEEGFVVAYPDALNGEWNYTRGVPGYADTHDDTAFLEALTDEIAGQVPVDPRRVYIAGFSNGGFMAQRVACERPERFAAFATVAAAGFGGMTQVCTTPGTTTAPILLMHGTADANVPWDGLGVTRGDRTVYVLYPVPDTLAYWAGFNGCAPDATSRDIPPSNANAATSARVLTVDCPDDAVVVLYIIQNGGHNWPGQPPGDPEIFGRINRDIDAGAEIWRFFEQHTREPKR